MRLKGISRGGLIDYLTSQLGHLFPDGATDDRGLVSRNLDQALARLERCLDAARMWKPGEFHHLHSEQNAVFLAYLANTAWQSGEPPDACAKIFYLNKALNGFTCFYDTPLPDILFVGHSVGIVLVRTRYPNYFAIWQNCTVGRNGEDAPVLEDGVVMYPGSAIVGRCHVRARTILSQGVSVINANTPGDAIAFQNGGKLAFRPAKRDILAEIFRL